MLSLLGNMFFFWLARDKKGGVVKRKCIKDITLKCRCFDTIQEQTKEAFQKKKKSYPVGSLASNQRKLRKHFLVYAYISLICIIIYNKQYVNVAETFNINFQLVYSEKIKAFENSKIIQKTWKFKEKASKHQRNFQNITFYKKLLVISISKLTPLISTWVENFLIFHHKTPSVTTTHSLLLANL